MDLENIDVPLPDPIRPENLADEVAAALGVPRVSCLLIEDHTLRLVVPAGSDRSVIEEVVIAHTGEPTPEQAAEEQVETAMRDGPTPAAVKQAYDFLKGRADAGDNTARATLVLFRYVRARIG